MSEFRFILGRRALIVFLALLVVTGALLGVPAATLTLAESPPPGSQEVSAASADSVAADGLILDPSGTTLLLRGGSGIGTWILVPTTPLFPFAPSARAALAMAATPSGVLLFGGAPDLEEVVPLNDTWLFNAANKTWSQITGSSTPPARQQFAMAATPSGNVLLFGGSGVSVDFFNDTWLFNTANKTWSQITGSPAPPKLYDHAMASTPSGVMLFGGHSASVLDYHDDTWLFNTDGAGAGTWTKLTITTSTPSPRIYHAMASTPSGNVLLFGGWNGSVRLDDTWVFNTAANTWTQVATTGARPSPRRYHAMAATPSGVLLSGGDDGSYRNDTWLFDAANNTWSQIIGSSAPPARVCHAMASTPAGAVLFGGYKSNSDLLNDTWLTPPPTPNIAVTSPTGNAHWSIGTTHDITWTATDLNSTTLTILLARNGVDFTETITHGLAYDVLQHTWTVTGPGTINATIRVQQEATEGDSTGFFTIADAYRYSGTPTTTLDPWLWIDAGTGSGTLWVTPLTPSLTSDPNLDQFIQETGQRSALFFDVGQEGLSRTLTIVLHFNHRLGEETFALYRWDGTGWIKVDGIPPSPNLVDHTFTCTINADDLKGTPFGLGGDPAAMPGMSPWALALLSLALLCVGGWWFSRRSRPA